jgi:hypothetical protein
MLYGLMLIGGVCGLLGYVLGIAVRGIATGRFPAVFLALLGGVCVGALAALLVDDENPPLIWVWAGIGGASATAAAVRGMRAKQAAEAINGVAEQLIANLNHDKVEVRYDAAKKLGELGAVAQVAVPHLEALFSDPDSLVRRTAAEAVAAIEKTQAVPAKADRQMDATLTLTKSDDERIKCSDCGFAYLKFVSGCPKCNPRG